MNFERRLPPIWLMGLSNATLGFSNGITLFVMPQLMAEAHVPEAKIATITAVALSANFWFVLFGPILDVRFSRRWYATFFAALSGVAATLAVLSVHRLIVLQIATVVCMAAVVMGAIVVMPAAVFPFMPAPGPDRRLAAESFLQFNREVVSLLGRREVVIVLLLFLSPCSSFVLPNLLGGLGADFHASARVVSLAGGAGAFVPGLIGCFLFPVIARRLRLRSFYFANGILGCLFTMSLVVLPHTTTTFALAVFGEFLFQAVAFSIQIGIVFDAIGPENPLAATTFSFLTAATNVPVTYITLIDGHAYSIRGITALLFTDAAIGILTCSIAFILLAKFDSRVARQKRLSIASTQEEG